MLDPGQCSLPPISLFTIVPIICALQFSYLCSFAISNLAIFLSHFAICQYLPFAICQFASCCLPIRYLFNVLCSFSARMGVCGPVPCRLGPLPGHLGRLPGGGSGPMSAGRSHSDPLDFRIEIYLILMSIFGCFGVNLGSLLGVIFAPLGAFFGPSWARNRLRTVLSSKK